MIKLNWTRSDHTLGSNSTPISKLRLKYIKVLFSFESCTKSGSWAHRMCGLEAGENGIKIFV